MILGNDGPFALARAVYSSANKARTTYLLAQASGDADSVDGDLVLDAGTGVSSGVVRLGPGASSVVVGASTSTTTSVVGALVASTASVTGHLRA
jgi:hypothetical protein